MRILAKTLLVAMSLLATSALTNEYGKVRLPGEATIKHDGDYIIYDLKFDSTCYTEEQDSITGVSNSVFSFVAWLDSRAANYSNGSIDYWVNLISTVRDENPYISSYYYSDEDDRIANPCYQKYSTAQTISIQVNRAADSPSVTNDMVQGLYNEIYQYLWPLNHGAETESNAWSSAKITRVHKGVHEETLEWMKEQAYGYATHLATARFLAVLGKNYGGQWFLNGADFTDERYVDSRSHEIADAITLPIAGAPIPPAIPAAPPAIINLEPLKYSVEGVFEFGFTRDFNNIAP